MFTLKKTQKYTSFLTKVTILILLIMTPENVICQKESEKLINKFPEYQRNGIRSLIINIPYEYRNIKMLTELNSLMEDKIGKNYSQISTKTIIERFKVLNHQLIDSLQDSKINDKIKLSKQFKGVKFQELKTLKDLYNEIWNSSSIYIDIEKLNYIFKSLFNSNFNKNEIKFIDSILAVIVSSKYSSSNFQRFQKVLLKKMNKIKRTNDKLLFVLYVKIKLNGVRNFEFERIDNPKKGYYTYTSQLDEVNLHEQIIDNSNLKLNEKLSWYLLFSKVSFTLENYSQFDLAHGYALVKDKKGFINEKISILRNIINSTPVLNNQDDILFQMKYIGELNYLITHFKPKVFETQNYQMFQLYRAYQLDDGLRVTDERGNLISEGTHNIHFGWHLIYYYYLNKIKSNSVNEHSRVLFLKLLADYYLKIEISNSYYFKVKQILIQPILIAANKSALHNDNFINNIPVKEYTEHFKDLIIECNSEGNFEYSQFLNNTLQLLGEKKIQVTEIELNQKYWNDSQKNNLINGVLSLNTEDLIQNPMFINDLDIIYLSKILPKIKYLEQFKESTNDYKTALMLNKKLNSIEWLINRRNQSIASTLRQNDNIMYGTDLKTKQNINNDLELRISQLKKDEQYLTDLIIVKQGILNEKIDSISTLGKLYKKLSDQKRLLEITNDKIREERNNAIFLRNIAYTTGAVTLIFGFFALFQRKQANKQKRIAEQLSILSEYKSKLWQEFGHVPSSAIADSYRKLKNTGANSISLESLKILERLLSNLFNNLRTGNDSNSVNLEDEIALAEEYINYRNCIWDNNIKFEKPSIIPQIKIPPAIILSTVKNAIEHGEIKSRKDGKIGITLENNEGIYECKILDNGVGFSFNIKNLNDVKEGTGLNNANNILNIFNKSSKNEEYVTFGHINQDEFTNYVTLKIKVA